MNFGDDLSKFSGRANSNIKKIKREVAIALFSAVIAASPVGDPDLWKSTNKDSKGRGQGPKGYSGGRFRANWRCSTNSINRKITENIDPTGSISKAAVASVCQTANSNDDLYLANSLPYAKKLEYDGHSSQAPQGMVRLNIARFRVIVKQQLAKIR